MALDLVVIGILLFSAIIAFMRGFVREVLTIASLGGAAAAALLFGPQFIPMATDMLVDPKAAEPQTLFGLVPYHMLAPVLAYAAVFVAVLLALSIVTHMVARGVQAVGLGPVDRSLGVVFGLMRGVIIIGLMSLVMSFVLSDTQREEYFGDSKTYPYISYLSDLTGALLPGREVLDKKDALKAALKGETPTGSEPLEPGQKVTKPAGYSPDQRQALDKLMAPAAGDKQTQPKTQFRFNN